MYQWLQRLFLGPARADAPVAHPAVPFDQPDLAKRRYHHWMFDTSARDGDLPPSAAEAYCLLRAIDGSGLAPPASARRAA